MTSQLFRVLSAALIAALCLSACGDGMPSGLAPLDATAIANPRTMIACALDSAFDQPSGPAFTIHAGQPVTLSGWIVDSTNQPPAKFSVALIGAQTYSVAGHTGDVRGDVATALNAQSATNSGFAITTNAKNVVSGKYAVLMFIERGANSTPVQLCEANRLVTVAP